MIKPKGYDNIISFFYDKTIKVYSPKEEVDEEFNVETIKGEFKEEFKGNIRHISKEAILRDFGLDIDASILITCKETKASENDYLEHNQDEYRVKQVLKDDTHVKVLANGA